MSEFPRLADTTRRRFSLTRTNQFPTVLEAGFAAMGWSGAISGLEVVDNGGVSVLIGAGSLISNGVPHEEASSTTYNGLPSDGTSYLWLRAERTAATQTDPSASDTYDLDVDDNTTGSPPAADAGWFAHYLIVTAGGDITSMTRLNSIPPEVTLQPGVTRLRPYQTATIPPDTQHIVYGSFVNEGTLYVLGDRYLLDF